MRGPGAWQVPSEEPVGVAGGMPSAVGHAPLWSSLPALGSLRPDPSEVAGAVLVCSFISFFLQQPRGSLQAQDTSSLPTVIMRSKRKSAVLRPFLTLWFRT